MALSVVRVPDYSVAVKKSAVGPFSVKSNQCRWTPARLIDQVPSVQICFHPNETTTPDLTPGTQPREGHVCVCVARRDDVKGSRVVGYPVNDLGMSCVPRILFYFAFRQAP
jgi:hypothetical protein